MRCLLVVLASVSFWFPSQVQGQIGDYVSIHSGWSVLEDYNGIVLPIERTGSFKTGFNLGGAVGWHIDQNWRSEAEFTYRNNRGDQWRAGPSGGPYMTQDWNGKLNSFTSMWNLYRKLGALSLCEYVTPYVGGGLGVAIQDGEISTATTTYRIDETGFAFQAMAGLDAQLCDQLTMFSEYRFFGNAETDLVDSVSAQVGDFNYSAHNVLIGLRVDY